MIDLHTHSTFSDGTLTPAQLAEAAGAAGLTAIALTDHDGTNGLGLFITACKNHGVLGIPGVEISADFNPGSMHILGYFIAVGNAALEEALSKIRDGRDGRNRRILGKLAELGMALKWEDVSKHAGEDVVGRPHFARAMIEAGYMATTTEAFDKWLGRGKPAYVDRFRLTPAEGIRLIRGAGGVAVLAHPLTLKLSDADLLALVRNLKEAGLNGVEAYYSEHDTQQTAKYIELAKEMGLIVTGGSDFHGDGNPDIKLGRGFGPLRVPDSILEPLFKAAGRSAPNSAIGDLG